MKKRIVLAVVLAALAAGLFAQAGDEKPKNVIVGGVYASTRYLIVPEIGFAAEYERIVLGNNFLGVAAEIGGGGIIALFPTWYFMAKARIYPFSGTFFAETGVGYKNTPSWQSSTFLVPLAMGWKIDFGEPGGLVFLSNIGLLFHFGGALGSEVGQQWKDIADTLDKVPGLKFSLSLGYAF